MAVKNRGNNAGITLVEILVVISVFLILMTATVGLFIRSLRGVGTTETIMESEDSAQLAIAVIERSVKNSRKLVAVGGGGCPGNGSSLQLIGGDNGVTTFSLNSGRIASNSAFITSPTIEITNFNFVCDTDSGAGNEITVSFTAEFKAADGSLSGAKQYLQTIKMRNL